MKIEDITAKDFKNALKDPQNFEAKQRALKLQDIVVNELKYTMGNISYVKEAGKKTVGVKFVISRAQPGQPTTGSAKQLHNIVQEAFKGWGAQVDIYQMGNGRAFAYEVWHEERI